MPAKKKSKQSKLLAFVSSKNGKLFVVLVLFAGIFGGIAGYQRYQHSKAATLNLNGITNLLNSTVKPQGYGAPRTVDPIRATFQLNGQDRCLDIPYSNYSKGIRATIYRCTGGNNQKWVWNYGTDFSIRPMGNTSMCLDLKDQKYNNGTHIYLWKCDGGQSQQWDVPLISNSAWIYQIKIHGSNNCLDSAGFGETQPVHLYTCNTANGYQRWLMNQF